MMVKLHVDHWNREMILSIIFIQHPKINGILVIVVHYRIPN